MIDVKLSSEVKNFLEAGDRGFLSTLKSLDRNDIEGQAVIRYLMQIKHWPFTPDSDFSDLLSHFFAEYPERKKLNHQEYQDITFALIKESFNYECIVVIAEPKPVSEKKPNPGKRSKRPQMIREEDSEGGAKSSKNIKSIAGNIDTTSASERLKKTIAIQRGL